MKPFILKFAAFAADDVDVFPQVAELQDKLRKLQLELELAGTLCIVFVRLRVLFRIYCCVACT
jgi:hypothetical protein